MRCRGEVAVFGVLVAADTATLGGWAAGFLVGSRFGGRRIDEGRWRVGGGWESVVGVGQTGGGIIVGVAGWRFVRRVRICLKSN